jgi:hypothetical protein
MRYRLLFLAVAACMAASAGAQSPADREREPSLEPLFALPAEAMRLPQARVAPRQGRSFQIANALGQTVAVIDTGVNLLHSSFAGRLAPAAYEVFGGTGNMTDISGHGTAVASIVAATRDPLGGALDPRVLAIRVFNGPTASDADLSAGLRYSVGRAAVANLSLAATGPIAEAAMMESVAAGQLVVAAAGNRGQLHPDWPARFAKEPWANGQIVAVGAVDAANQIASFSNRAGDTKAFYLVAPGVGIPAASATSITGTVSFSGTSAATPFVAGAAALIQSYWPYLSASQVANVLFVTATDLGDPGVDDIYGNGLLNLQRALQPIGTTSLPLASGRAVPLSTITISPGAVAGAGLRAAAQSGQLQSVALDAMGRRFYLDLGASVPAAPKLSGEQLFGTADRATLFGTSRTSQGGRMLYGVATDLPGAALGGLTVYEGKGRPERSLAGVSYVQPLANGHELAFGTLGLAGTYFGVNALDAQEPSEFHASALVSPLFGLAGAHHHLAAGHALGHGLKLKYGLVSSQGTTAMLEQIAPTSARPTVANVLVLELSKQSEAGALGASVQQLREEAGYLGMLSGEAYRLTTNPVTTALTMSGRYRFAPGWSVAAQYTVGATPAVVNTSDSLIAGVTASRSTGFALGLLRTDAWQQGDRFALTLSQPLRAASGALILDLPADVTAGGTLLRTTQTVPLGSGGRERLTELSYTWRLSKYAGLGFSLLHRLQPNHEATAPAERAIALRFSTHL